jgi:hypothetical protein
VCLSFVLTKIPDTGRDSLQEKEKMTHGPNSKAFDTQNLSHSGIPNRNITPDFLKSVGRNVVVPQHPIILT